MGDPPSDEGAGPKAPKPKREKKRADQLLVERGLVPTRSRAQALILAGEVFSEDRRVEKAGEQLPVDVPLHVREQQKYVSRGGLKLEGALTDTGFSPEGLVVADIGASTGGFTDCVLQRGAVKVYAVDVGHGQLAEKLRQDARVVVMERTNARTLTSDMVDGGVDLVVVDASFISLEKLLPAISAITRPGGHLLALIKPQFEVGREEATRGQGVIRDPKVRARAIFEVIEEVKAHAFSPLKEYPCRLPGPKGNVEHFVLAQKN
jgi:23S rRNA (cytidine1920-2'-O)/16S rRNA (cytidine1409-2'-O)-methyltransferase